MGVQCLLWDFGNTLCDELSLWRASTEWMEVYRSFGDEAGIGAAWNRGELGLEEVVASLARRMPYGEAEIRAHLSRTDLFAFFPFTYAFFRARHLPQAIVTVNPTHFRVLARALGLAEVTETIVVSAEEKTVDKATLCEIALDRMPGGFSPEHALLIDEKPDNVGGWRRRGGLGYHYTTDDAFRADAQGGIDGLPG